jgi:hypothetical protein
VVSQSGDVCCGAGWAAYGGGVGAISTFYLGSFLVSKCSGQRGVRLVHHCVRLSARSWSCSDV